MADVFRRLNRPLPWLITGILLFVYMALRSWKVPMVHDEIATYFHYVLFGTFIPYQTSWDANNHILNSLLSWISMHIFSDHPFFLRLSNLLSFGLYLFTTWKISRWFVRPSTAVMFLLGMWLIHGYVEFFGYTRGYGLSMGLLFAGIWQMGKGMQRFQAKRSWIALTLFFLAVAANLTLVNSYLILLVLMVFFIIRKKKAFSQPYRKAAWLGIAGMLLIIPVLIYVFDLKEHGALYYGGQQGFIYITLESMTLMLTRSVAPAVQSFLLMTGIAGLIAGGFYLMRDWFDRFEPTPRQIMPILFGGTLTGIFLMAWLLKVNYPSDRTSLFLIPFLVGTLAFGIDKAPSPARLLLMIPLVILPIHFVWCMNLSYSMQWMEDRVPVSFIQPLKEFEKQNNRRATIGGNHIKDVIWAYNNYQYDYDVNLLYFGKYPSQLPDFQYVREDQLYLYQENYKVIVKDPYFDNLLLERREPVETTPLFNKQIPATAKTDQEYLEILGDTGTWWKSRPMLLEYTLFVRGDEKFDPWFVISVFDENEEAVYYDRLFGRWAMQEVPAGNGWKEIRLAQWVELPPKDSKRIILYIWNRNRSTFEVAGGKLKCGAL